MKNYFLIFLMTLTISSFSFAEGPRSAKVMTFQLLERIKTNVDKVNDTFLAFDETSMLSTHKRTGFLLQICSQVGSMNASVLASLQLADGGSVNKYIAEQISDLAGEIYEIAMVDCNYNEYAESDRHHKAINMKLNKIREKAIRLVEEIKGAN